VNYGQTSTPQSIASALASAFYNDPSAPATATASGATVNLTSRVAGQGTNYSLSSSRAYDTAHFSQPSFTTSNSGSTLTGASDVIYDSGSVSITADGLTKTASFGQNSTASGIATALASAFNGDASSTVDAVASGGTVTLTNKTTGAHAVYSASYSYNNGVFAQSSFTPALVNDYAMVRGEVFIGSAHFATYTNGHTYFHHTNWLGSESSRTDETGTKVQDCEWQSFGELKGCTGVQLDAITPYGYAGYERDSETGLDHMQFRYYNPRIGRFLSPDLLSGDTSSPQSFNKFGYAVGDPINRFDPTGLVDQCGRNCHDGEGSGPDWDDRMFNALARAFGGGGGGAGSGGGNCSINNLSVACPPGWSVRVRSIPVNVVVGCMYCGWDGNQLVKAGIWLTEPGWLQIPEWTFDPYAYSQAWGRQQRSKVKGMFPDEQITPEKAIAAIEASFAYIPMLCDPTFISISGKIGPFEGSSTYNTGTGSWTFSDKSQGGKWPPEIKANLKSLSINAGVTLAIPKTNLKASGGIKVQYTVTNYKDCAHP
jgi:RHS repeat-associated protein